MTKKYIPISLAVACTLAVSGLRAQDSFSRDFAGIRSDLVSWDPVRGEWLSSSLVAMSQNQPIPDRNFPEDFTPMEMLKVVPENTRMRIMSAADQQLRNNRDSSTANQWRNVSSTLNRVTCSPVMGRSYGDPHLTTFDGVSNSFQTVGEFIMVKSASGNMEVQVRQKATSDEISVSTAIAMNVAGDRVAIYGKDAPDGNTTTPLRINGEIIYLEDATYYLPHGGTITAGGGRGLSRDTYTINWPTGETVKVAGTSQMNIAVNVFPCGDRYSGILGNANNDRSDDFNPRGMNSGFGDVASRDFGDSRVSDDMQRQYLAFLSKDFAMSWRITPEESLFDYGFNQSTYTFTDLSYPRVHRTINDMSQNDRERARRECERAGITGSDLNGCIYDVGFARIPPSPRPVIADRTVGRVVTPVTTPTPNVNPGISRPVGREVPTPNTNPVTRPVEREVKAPSDERTNPVTAPVAQPMDKAPSSGQGTVEKPLSKENDPGVSKPVIQANPVDRQPASVSPTKEPVKTPAYEPPVEEKRPARVINTTPRTTQPERISSPTPVKAPTPQPVKAPAPEPVKVSAPRPVSTPAPAPVKTPAPVSTPAPSRTVGRGL